MNPSGLDDATVPEVGDAPASLPDFRLLAKIGQGGFGSVWIAQHAHTGDAVAIKFIPPVSRATELKGLQHLRQRVREGQDHLVWTEYIGEADGFIYCVMDLADPVVDGPLFADRYEAMTLLKYQKQRGRLDLAEAAAVTLAIAKGLAFLQAVGLRHGDVKPANVLRVRGKWKLADYGMMGGLDARARGGTRSYLPPEGPHGDRADQFALGVVLFELVFGHKPSKDARESWAESRLGTGLRRVQQRLVEVDPARRFASLQEVVDELDRLTSATIASAASGTAGACPSCGEGIHGSEEVCGNCGGELWQQCPVCQERGSMLLRYCTQCRGPVHGVAALRQEVNEADRLLSDGRHRECRQRLDGPVDDLRKEVERDLGRVHSGDLARRRRAESLRDEFVGRIRRMSDKCRLLEELDRKIASASDAADVVALRDGVQRALEIVPGAVTYEGLRANLPALESRSRWNSLLVRLGNPHLDPKRVSAGSLQSSIVAMKQQLPAEPQVRSDAKAVIDVLEEELFRRLRGKCSKEADLHLEAGRPLVALRWLRRAESRKAADSEMRSRIEMLASSLAEREGPSMRSRAQDLLAKSGHHRELRRLARDLATIELGKDTFVERLRKEWQRRRRIDLLRRISARCGSAIQSADRISCAGLLDLAYRLAGSELQIRDRVIDLDNEIESRFRTLASSMAAADAAAATGDVLGNLAHLEQAERIAPRQAGLASRLQVAREAAARLPRLRRRRRLVAAAGLAVAAGVIAVGAYHVMHLKPLRAAFDRVSSVRGRDAAAARAEALAAVDVWRMSEQMLLTDLGTTEEIRDAWKASWARSLADATAAADQRAPLIEELPALKARFTNERGWCEEQIAAIDLATFGANPRRADPSQLLAWFEALDRGGELAVTARERWRGLVRDRLESTTFDSVSEVRAWKELAAAITGPPELAETRALIGQAVDQWCGAVSQRLDDLASTCREQALVAGPAGVSAALRVLPVLQADAEICALDFTKSLRELETLETEAGWQSVVIPAERAPPLQDGGQGRRGLEFLPCLPRGGEALVLVSRFVIGGDVPIGGWSADRVRQYCRDLGTIEYLGWRWEARIPSETMWRGVMRQAVWAGDVRPSFADRFDEWLATADEKSLAVESNWVESRDGDLPTRLIDPTGDPYVAFRVVLVPVADR